MVTCEFFLLFAISICESVLYLVADAPLLITLYSIKRSIEHVDLLVSDRASCLFCAYEYVIAAGECKIACLDLFNESFSSFHALFRGCIYSNFI